MIIVTIIAFIVIFSLLILIHEFGHFYMARRAGIKVEEFGIGLPPRAKKIYKDSQGTVYSLNWIPFGGYVKLYGEDSSDPKVLKAKNSFASKTLWQRTGVIVAGVVMNFVLAWLLITIGFMIGMRPFLITPQDLEQGIEQGIVDARQVLYIHEVEAGSPAALADIKSGDIIALFNEEAAPVSETFGKHVKVGEKNHFKIIRDDKEMELNVMPSVEGRFGFAISTEQFIVSVDNVRYPIYKAPIEAAKEVGRLSALTVKVFGDVIVSVVGKFTVPDGVAGPVGIAKMTHAFVQEGLMALLQFTALISISLGVINIMPFPALDGGRLLFIVFEAVLRRRPNAQMEAVIHTVGFVLLIALLFIVTWNDIIKLFG